MGNNNTSSKLFRSRCGIIFGVCQGLSEWRDLPVGYIRVGVIIAFTMTGFFPVGLLYLAAGFFLPLEPKQGKSDYYERNSRGRREYRRNHRKESRRERSEGYTFDDIKEEFDDISSRVNRMEDEMIDKEKDWEKRFHEDK